MSDVELYTKEEFEQRTGRVLGAVNQRILGCAPYPIDIWCAIHEVYKMGFEPQASKGEVVWYCHGWRCHYEASPPMKWNETFMHLGFSGRDNKNRRYTCDHKRIDQLMAEVERYSAIDAQINASVDVIHTNHVNGRMALALYEARKQIDAALALLEGEAGDD